MPRSGRAECEQQMAALFSCWLSLKEKNIRPGGCEGFPSDDELGSGITTAVRLLETSRKPLVWHCRYS